MIGNSIKNLSGSWPDTPSFPRVQYLAGRGDRVEVIKAIPPVRDGKREDPRRFQQSLALLEEGEEIRHVLDHMTGNDPVIAFGSPDQIGIGLPAPDKIHLFNVVEIHIMVALVFLPEAIGIKVVDDMHVVSLAFRSQRGVGWTYFKPQSFLVDHGENPLLAGDIPTIPSTRSILVMMTLAREWVISDGQIEKSEGLLTPLSKIEHRAFVLSFQNGAACRIRTGDPLITKKSARKGEFCKWLILRGQDVVTSLERQPHSFFIGMEGQQ